jgi:hypothetical protein
MKVGMVFECGPQGADKAVCSYLVRALREGAEISAVTLDNKDNLLRDAGKVVRQLLAEGCRCVLVIWDLRPAWPRPGRPCRAKEVSRIDKSLRDAGVPTNASVHLVCIEQELESWLLACDHALSALLSTAAHAYVVSRVRAPDRARQPKAEIIRHFKLARGWRYDDKVDAIRVLQAAPIDWKRLRRSDSFTRFEQRVTGC